MLLFAFALACSEPAAPPAEPTAAAPAAPAAPAADPHAAHHGGGSDHMKQMAATRDALRTKLGAAYDQPVPGLEAANAENGKALYATHCASCHGEAGKGDGPAGQGLTPPAADLTDAFHARFYADAGRVLIVREGSPNTAMTGFAGKLSDGEILDTYAYVASLRGGVPGAHEHSPNDQGAHQH